MTTGDPVDLLARATEGGPDAQSLLEAALDAIELIPPAELDGADDLLHTAGGLARELGDVALEKRAVLRTCVLQYVGGDLASAVRTATEIATWAAANGNAEVLCRCHFYLSTFFRHIGDSAQSLEHAVQCVKYSTERIRPELRARHIQALGVALGLNGLFDDEQSRYTEALAIATDVGDAELSLRLLNDMAYGDYESGDADAAVEHIEQMRAVAAAHGVDLDGPYLDTIARVEMMHGRHDAAERILSPLLRNDPSVLPAKEWQTVPEWLRTLAEAQRRAGALDRAQATLDRAAELCERLELASARIPVRQEQAALYAAMGRFQEAYEEHQRFHQESELLRATEREARAQAMHVVYETHEARRASQQFRDLALRDPLTDLPNRRFVNERLPVLLDAAVDRPLSAALIDLDHFKRINDTLSHDAGDAVLVAVAGILADAVSEPAFAARMGGEEFLVVLPETDTAAAVLFCDKLREIVQWHDWQPVTGDLPVTASLGVTTARAGETTPAALLSEADRNLYAAKRTGRNRVVADPG